MDHNHSQELHHTTYGLNEVEILRQCLHLPISVHLNPFFLLVVHPPDATNVPIYGRHQT